MMATKIVPITSLDPTAAPPADAAIRAVVTLIWPYSSSTKHCALLLADPDFRLRNKKGQVRVQFLGASAEAVALGKLGIGDELRLELKGAAWAESGNAVRTPGRSVDGELAYGGELGLQKADGEWIRARESRPPPPVQETMQTPVPHAARRVGLLRSSLGGLDDAVPIYSSPAFVRISRLSGNGFGDGYDPFTGEYEDLEAEGPRKRARISFGGVGKWRLAGRTPSPEKEDQASQEADVDVDMEEDVATAEAPESLDTEQLATRKMGLPKAPAMAPPSLPRLEVPEAPPKAAIGTPQVEDEPSTPNLRPVPSSTLPLPSPFPREPQTTETVLGRQPPADPNFSLSASASQPSLGLSQSLPDTAEPEDDDIAGSTGIYAHNGSIEGTYREHVAHPEYLSDTEEDEGLYEEHMRQMREEGQRDEYNYSDDEHDVHEDDAEEVIDDMGEEPEESSDEEMEENAAETTSKAPSSVDINNESERERAAEDVSQSIPASGTFEKPRQVEQSAAHQPAAEYDFGSQYQEPITQDLPVPTEKDISPAEFTISRKRNASPQAIPAPQTPAKIPAGVFGLDGTSTTAQSTPQSERDRVMAKTYSSLFGFGASPAPPQPSVQTPTPNGEMFSMGRVNTGSHQEDPPSVSVDVADGAAPPPRTDTVGDKMPSETVPPAAMEDVSEIRETSSEAERPNINNASTLAEKSSPIERRSPTPTADNARMADASIRPIVLSEAQPDAVEAHETEQPGRAGDAPAALLEAAIEGDEGRNEDAREELSNFDHVMKEAPEVNVSPNTHAAVPSAVPPPSQVEVIDLDSSDEEEEEEEGHTMEEERQALSEDSPTDQVEDVVVSAFPGSPTEVDSDEDELGDQQHQDSPSSPSQATKDQEEIGKELPEREIPETLQTPDAQTIHPDEDSQEGGFFADQMQASQEIPTTQTRNTRSFHYFSFQSTTSAANESFAEGGEAAPVVDATVNKQTKVIELSSSSPAPEIQVQNIDAVVESTGLEGHAVDGDEQMSDDQVFSPEPSSTRQSVVLEAEQSLSGDRAETQRTSHAIEDDEQMSDVKAFSPVSVAQDVSLHPSDLQTGGTRIADASDAGVASSHELGSMSRPSGHLTSALDALSHAGDAMLPPSPDDSQNWETQLPPVAHQVNRTHLPEAALHSNQTTFPPTPQLTQGDSLIRDAEDVVKAAQPHPALFDPPSRHTRSSGDPAVVEASHSRHTTPDPPSRHTRSSADPTAVNAMGHSHTTPDPPSRHTRSSVEPTAVSPPQRTPARRSTRQAQTQSQVSEDPTEEAGEGEDTIAVLSPHQKTPVRKSPRKAPKATPKKVKMGEAEESSQLKTPAKKSLTSRLSNVPDVISAWFSPRRSTRLHHDEDEAEGEDEPKQLASKGFSTALGYYTPLSNLSQKMNSQVRADNTIDAIAVVIDSTKAPERAKTGPKDYFTCFKIWDISLEHETSVLVEVFRPWKATLPMAEVGDVILLRGFMVKSRKRQPYLISSDTSGWCVWRYAEYEGVETRNGKKRSLSFSGIKEEIKGPPVELGKEERDRVGEVREAWEKLP